MKSTCIINNHKLRLRYIKQLIWRDEFTPGYLDFPWVDPGEIIPQGNRWIYDLPWGIGKFVQNLSKAPPQGNWQKYPEVPRGKWP